MTWLVSGCGRERGSRLVGSVSQAGYVYDARYSEGEVVGSEIKVVSKRVTASN